MYINKNQKNKGGTMKKILKDLKNGAFLFLPLVAFVLIIWWVFKLLIGSVSWIIDLLPQDIHVLPSIALDAISLVLLLLIVWGLGALFNHYLGRQLKKLLSPIVDRIPLLRTLYRVTNQVKSTLENTDSFKKVVVWNIRGVDGNIVCKVPGFVTSDSEDYSFVYFPSCPNPMNGMPPIAIPNKDLQVVDMPVSEGLTLVITMGTAGAEKILQASNNEGSAAS